MQGWVAPLDEVPDPVFSDRMLGDGVAIDPTDSAMHAPCDGVVASAAAHAVTIRTSEGAEILIHVGLETVALGGRGLVPHVREGEAVRAGDLLISFDLDFIATHAKSLISPVILINGDAFEITRTNLNREAARGDFLMEIRRRNGALTAESLSQKRVQREASVGFAHGLHARPAALIANAAKGFRASLSISFGGRAANAKSVTALMSLGVRQGDRVIVSAEGEDADAAAERVSDLLRTAAGEPATPRPAAHVEPVLIPATSPNEIRGICASPGVAVGPIHHLRTAEMEVDEAGKGISAETEALTRAVVAVRSRLAGSAEKGSRAQRDILHAHIALIEDTELRRTALVQIEAGKSAGYAWRAALRETISALEQLDDHLMRERAKDILDLERQVLAALSPDATAAQDVPAGSLLIAENVLPSQLVALGAKLVGICTASGGPMSHVAIIATGMGIPALVGAGEAVLASVEGSMAILNADAGVLLLNPEEHARADARARIESHRKLRQASLARAHEDCRTADGVRIAVFANLQSGAAEATAAIEQGAEGCGLLRTEFLFLGRDTAPDEDEQARCYQAIAEALAEAPLVVRTLDIGGDKPAPFLDLPAEANPAMGLRGVRVSLAWPEYLRAQLRAILRVQPAGQCRILIPMVASVSELLAVRAMIDAVRGELGHHEAIQVGVMIETPAAAITADLLAAHADFLSIGTNDLTQYALAMDRENPQLAGDIDALHPAVLRLIAATAQGARTHGRQVAVCGGLAADAAAAAILIGLGVTELSAPPSAIPDLKAAVRVLSLGPCEALAARALECGSAAEVRSLIGARS
jgi:phosphocarrier protein FPr/phosphocarrier protein